MSLNRKDFEILSLLSSTEIDEKNIKNLSKIFKTSERGIRYSIENINYYLKGISSTIININNGNISFTLPFEKLKFFCGDCYRGEYLFSKDEREEYILISTLFKENNSLTNFQEYFQISSITLKKDLKKINIFLQKFQLTLNIFDKKIFITGNEKKLRHLKMIFALKYMYLKENSIFFLEKFYFFQKDILEILKNYIEIQDIYHCVKILREIENGMNIAFEKEFRNIMVIYLIVTFERIKKNKIILKKNNSSFLRKTKSYEVIKEKFFSEEKLNYEYEALHLAEYFLSGYNSEEFYENRFCIDIFVYKLLEKLENILNISLLNNDELIENLIEYLITAVYRVKNNFILNRKIDIDMENLNIKNSVELCANELMSYLKEPLREEEILWITKTIIKNTSNIKPDKVSLIKILEIIKNNSLSCDAENIAKEITNLYPTFIKDDREIYKSSCLLDVISEEMITFTNSKDLNKVIKIMSNILYEQKIVNKEFSNGIIEMVESQNYNYFSNEKVVICYGKEYSHCKKIGASIILFKDNILIEENKPMKTLILVSNKNRDKHLKIVSDLEKLIKTQNFFSNAALLEKSKDVINEMEKILKIGGFKN